ncbi:MAG: outer membrane lipid asymmetry maintenance protein MlaD [Betaproteobacteria bacterium]|nr:outer membrane lipid asymmetry maintenance protein MlaD [Betaproteobacteria bacterium]
MKRSQIDLGVGVFVVIGIVALIFLALRVGNLGGEKIQNPYEISAYFDNIGGLKVRAPVKVAGVVIGRVTDIGYSKDRYRALVTLKLDGRYEFSKDTYFTINTSGLLGEQYVGVEPGGDDQDLQPGDQTTHTQSAIVLEKLIGRFMIDKAAESGDQK